MMGIVNKNLILLQQSQCIRMRSIYNLSVNKNDYNKNDSENNDNNQIKNSIHHACIFCITYMYIAL